MTDYSLLTENESRLDCLESEIQSIFKVPLSDSKFNEIAECEREDKYLIEMTDGQLLWVTCTADPVETNDKSTILIFHNTNESSFLADNNVLNVSSLEDSPNFEDDLEEDINPDDILKVEDRVKVYDAILAPAAEKKVKTKSRAENESGAENDSVAKYICDLCGSSFMRAIQYYGHLHQHSGELCWECQFCSDTTKFSSQSQLRKHEKKFHLNLRPHACNQCGATFDRPSQLNYHTRRIHDGERPYACQICSKAFFKHSDLRTHLNIHLSVHGCMCEICGRRFSHVSNLIRHMRTHSGIKPYPCSTCGRRFNQLNALNEHKISHMNQMPITCCGKEFKTQVMFRKHVKLLHQNNSILRETAGSRRRFHCKVCGNSFPFLILLQRHEMTHDQFTCSGCKKELNSLEELKSHSCNKPDVLQDELIADNGDNDTLSSIYLDQCADWIDTQSISESHQDKLDQLNQLQVEVLLDEAESLTCSEVDKLVRETCIQVDSITSPNVDILEVDKLVRETCIQVDSIISPNVDSLEVDKLVRETCNQVESITSPNVDSLEVDKLVRETCNQVESITSPNVDSLEVDSFITSIPPTLPSPASNLLTTVTENSSHWLETVSLSQENAKQENCILLHTEKSAEVQRRIQSPTRVTCEVDPEFVHFLASDLKVLPVENKNKTKKDSSDSLVKDGGDVISGTKQQICNEGHIKQVKDGNTKLYTCPDCGKTFKKTSNFRQHLGIHDVGRQLYHCKVCSRSFAWKSTLNKHAITHMDNSNPPLFPCECCKKVYTSSSVLQAHINRDHLKQRPHKCSTCQKSFFKKYDLKIHFRTHTNERPYICETCGRRFVHVSHLIRHERIHSGQRPYQCSYCPAAFSQSTSLNTHLKHHEKPKHKLDKTFCYEFIIEHPQKH